MPKTISIEEYDRHIAELQTQLEVLKKTRSLLFKEPPSERSPERASTKSGELTADDLILGAFAHYRKLTRKQAGEYLTKKKKERIYQSNARNMIWIVKPALKRLEEAGKIAHVGGSKDNPAYSLKRP